MSDVSSSIEEDENLLDLHYKNKKQMHDIASGPQVTSTVASNESKPRRKSTAKQRGEVEEVLNMLHGSDPLRVELTRLENEVREKDRELADAQAEIKALKLTERSKEKALEELSDALSKMEAKLKKTATLLENKNLEVKKINDEKKEALAAQFAAEATLRRVHAAQKDEDMPPIEAILAPLEAELKISRQETAKLQDDNRALDRLTKSKEAALVEAERMVQIAEIKASLVDDLQNQNQELMKQIEICQEENKILDKMHRQKVAEVEKLSTTVAELEEAVLAGGAAANVVRERQRQVNQLLEEKKTLERELARAKVSANRVASVVANEWKDANDKVMPVKQWLEERRFMQGEMQQLRDKLAIAERAAKTEAQLKEKFHLRLRVLEDGLKGSTNCLPRRMASPAREEGMRTSSFRRQSVGGVDDPSRVITNGYGCKRRNSSSQLRGSISSSVLLKNSKLMSRSFDGGNLADNISSVSKSLLNGFDHKQEDLRSREEEAMDAAKDCPVTKSEGTEDMVSGVLYDMLQKEVIYLRKSCLEKDQSLKDKDDAMEMLARKVDTLTKAMDVEAKKMRREMANMEKEVAAMRANAHARRQVSGRGAINSSQTLSGRGPRNS